MREIKNKVLDWLLEGDPAIRWQVLRDLVEAKPSVYEKERAKVAKEGWGKRFLSFQDKEGAWVRGGPKLAANSLYVPKFTSTHYTLLALRYIGLAPKNPQALKACKLLINSALLPNLGPSFSKHASTHGELCVTGMILSMLAYFQYEDERIHRVAEFLVSEQMEDKGWNCRSWRGDRHASFVTTCLVLEGLYEYQQLYPKSKVPVSKAQVGGREFLLQHRLYKSHRTGEVVKQSMTRFPFPPPWQYDFLHALDYFQASEAPRDERASDAIELLLSYRDEDGRWPQHRAPAGKYFFQIETVGKPSRWNTLRALRVLKWWES